MPEIKNASTGLMHFLPSVPLFSDIREDLLPILAQSCRVYEVNKGELLFTQYERADAVYIVRSGCIALFLATPDGRELIINEMNPGDCFGELSLLTDQPRSTGAMARVSSVIITIPSESFMDVLKADPDLMQRVLTVTAQRLRVSSERESALAFFDSSARVARVLLILDHQENSEGVIRITQEELAQHAGLARQTVARILGQWRSAGWIETRRGEVVLLDKGPLKTQTEK